MTHFQDEGHYQEMMNAQAQAEYDAMMQDQQAQAEAEHESEIEAERKLSMESPKYEQTGLTLGQKLVGLTFNPSGDIKVQITKELCAELADMVLDCMDKEQITGLQKTMIDHALMQILNVQMSVVKVLTFKP